jgi:glutaredoxin
VNTSGRTFYLVLKFHFTEGKTRYAGGMDLPIIYIKPGCPWCVEVMDFLEKKRIEVETVVVSGNREAMREMIELSGQSKAPTMDWHGEVLADFGVDELIPFLRNKGVC